MNKMDTLIIDTLFRLTFRNNDEVKIAAILALSDYQLTTKSKIIITRLIELYQDDNKDIAIASIRSLSKLSFYFYKESKDN